MDRSEKILMWVAAIAMGVGLLGAYAALGLSKAYGAPRPKASVSEKSETTMPTEKLWSQSYNQAKEYYRKEKYERARVLIDTAIEEGGDKDSEVRMLKGKICYKQLDIGCNIEEMEVVISLTAEAKDEKSVERREEARSQISALRGRFGKVLLVPARGFPDMLKCQVINVEKKKVVQMVMDRIRSGKDTGPWSAYFPVGEKCEAGSITITITADKEPSIPVPTFQPKNEESPAVFTNQWAVGGVGAATAGTPIGVSLRYEFFQRKYLGFGAEAATWYTFRDMPYTTKRLWESDVMARVRLGPTNYYLALGGGGTYSFSDKNGFGWMALAALGGTYHRLGLEVQARLSNNVYSYWLAPLCVSYSF